MQGKSFPADSPDRTRGESDSGPEKTWPDGKKDHQSADGRKEDSRPREEQAGLRDVGYEQGEKATAQQGHHRADKTQQSDGQSRPELHPALDQYVNLPGSSPGLRGSEEGHSRISQIRLEECPEIDPGLQDSAHRPHPESKNQGFNGNKAEDQDQVAPSQLVQSEDIMPGLDHVELIPEGR